MYINIDEHTTKHSMLVSKWNCISAEIEARMETSNALISTIRTLAGDFAWQLDCLPPAVYSRIKALILEENENCKVILDLLAQLSEVAKEGTSFWHETNVYFEQLTETEQKEWQKLVKFINALETIHLHKLQVYSEQLVETLNRKSGASNIL